MPATLRTGLLHAELVDEGACVGRDVVLGLLGPLGESLESPVQARFVTVRAGQEHEHRSLASERWMQLVQIIMLSFISWRYM